MISRPSTLEKIAIVPARGGSKRIPHKNKKMMAGKPLICWVIESLMAARAFDRVVVSTDDPEIAEIAVAAGAFVNGLRPAHLAEDQSTTLDVVIHELDHLPDCRVGVLVQPTSPLVLPEDIGGLMSVLISPGISSVVSVASSRVSASTLFEICEQDGILRSVASPNRLDIRQATPRWVELNGAIYGFHVDWLRKNQAFIGTDTVGFTMPIERSVDVDTELDWILAEQILLSRKAVL